MLGVEESEVRFMVQAAIFLTASASCPDSIELAVPLPAALAT